MKTIRIKLRRALSMAIHFGVVTAIGTSFCTGPCNSQSTGSYETSGGRESSSGNGTWSSTDYVVNIKGYGTRPEDVKKIELEFFEPTLDTFGKRATFEGRMLFVGGDGGDAIPVNWFQGITVLVSSDPDAPVDWANAVYDKATLSETATLNSDGTFSVEFSLRELPCDVRVVQKLQIGATIAKTKAVTGGSQSLTWTSKDKLLAESIREIKLPASSQLPSEIYLIDQACEWPFEDEDGAKLMRAVNALHALGKEEALAAMRRYLKQTIDPFEEDDLVVFWILRSLFEPVDLEQRSFRPMIFVALYVDPKTQAQLWPWDPMDVVDQMPLMLGGQIGGGGAPEGPESHLDWFEKHGLMRSQPLNPMINPLIAAERLFKSKKFQTIKDSEFETHFVRRQALAMAGAPRDPEGEYATDAQAWARHLSSKLATKIWDAEKQQFVLPDDQ